MEFVSCATPQATLAEAGLPVICVETSPHNSGRYRGYSRRWSALSLIGSVANDPLQTFVFLRPVNVRVGKHFAATVSVKLVRHALTV
jgi:hypothetical protein